MRVIGRKVTIDLDDPVYRRTKKAAAVGELSVKRFIQQAIEQKLIDCSELETGSGSNGGHSGSLYGGLSGGYSPYDPNIGKFTKIVVHELARFFSEKTSYDILNNKCTKLGIDTNDLDSNGLTPRLIQEVCQSVFYLSNNETKEFIRKRLAGMSRGEE